MVRRLLAVVVALALAALAAAAPAGAAGLRLVAPRADFAASDGERYVVWGRTASDRATVLDTRTGRRHAVAKPAGCLYTLGLARVTARGGRALGLCPDGTSVLLDVRTGALRPLPRRLATREGAMVDVDWGTLGRAWVSGVPDCPRPGTCGIFYLDVATGAVRDVSAEHPIDLDRRAFGDVAPCAGQRAALRRLARPEPGLDREWLPLRERSALLDVRPAALALRRCGRPTRVIARGRVVDPRISAGAVTWHDGLGRFDIGGSTDTRAHTLTRYDVRTGRRATWRLPRRTVEACDGPPGPVAAGEADHTRDAVVWAAIVVQTGVKICDELVYAVYVAPLAP